MEDDHTPNREHVDVLSVDDQESFRASLRDLIAASPGFSLIGEAGSGEEALDLVDALAPDLVLMDVRMPGIGGIDATRILSTRRPDVVVWLISVDGPDSLPEVASVCGAAAFVCKEDLRPRLLQELWSTNGYG